MSRRLLVAFAVVLAIGALLDATVHGDDVGVPTVGDRLQADARFEGRPYEPAVPTLVGRAAGPGAVDGRYSLYLVLRDLAPGGTLVVDERFPRGHLSEVYARTIGGIAEIRSADLGDVLTAAVSGRSVDERSGAYQHGPWSVRSSVGPTDTLLLVDVDGTKLLIDARLVPDLDAGIAGPPARPVEEVTRALTADRPPSIARAVIGETVVLVILLLAGGLLLPQAGLRSAVRIPLALTVGVALLGALGPLQLLAAPLRVGGGLPATLGVAVALSLAMGARGHPLGWRRDHAGPVALTVLCILAVVGWARTTVLLVLTPDSRDYWAGGALLADGGLTPALLDVKRGISQQALHAVGFTLGIEGLQAVGTVLLSAGVVLLAVGGAVRTSIPKARTIPVLLPALLPALLGVAVVVSPQLRSMAAYLNGHMLIAVLLLALVLLLGAGATGQERRAFLPAVAVVATAITMTRAEGALLVVLVLLGTLVGRGSDVPWRGPWVALSAGTLVWAGTLALGERASGAGLTVATLLLVLVGLGAGVVALLLPVVPVRVRARMPLVVGIALWSVALLVGRSERVVFVDAAVENLGRGSGGWGVVGPLLLIGGLLGVVATIGVDDRTTAPARWLLIGFIPLTLLVRLGDGFQAEEASLAAIVDGLSGGGRTGWGDSVNRMWTHAALLVPLLLTRVPDPRRERWRTTRPASAALAVLVLVAGGWIAWQWQPAHIDGLATVREQSRLDVADGAPVDTFRPMGELVDGVEVRQTFRPTRPSDHDVVVPLALCVEVPFVTFGRDVGGEVRIDMAIGDRSASRVVTAADLLDWVAQRICLDLDDDLSWDTVEQEGVEVVVNGRGAIEGAAAAVLEAPGAAFGAILSQPDPDGTVIARRVDDLVVRIVSVDEVPVPLLTDPLERSPRLLPWLAVILAVATVAAQTSARGSRPVGSV